ncbi:MAG: histidine kinase [Corynebacterium sp.]|nr:histidine kinase [Corynebacterium sp.]
MARRITEERLRIARDLHDTVAHQISVISLNAGVASQMMERDPGQAQESLVAVRSAARVVLREIGDLLEHLRTTEQLEEYQWAAAPQPHIDQILHLIERFSEVGLQVTLVGADVVSHVPTTVGRVAYRIVQEALTNAYKHDAPSEAVVKLMLTDSILRIVVTNPIATDVEKENESHGFGLVGLQEQAASVRGALMAGMVDDSMWQLSATLPLVSEGNAA